MHDPAVGQSARRLDWLGISGWILGLAIIAAAHAPSLHYGFLAWDDDLHVTRNPAVLSPSSVPLRQWLLTPSLGYPIPVTIASFALQAKLLGLSAWHFHLVNILLHLANCASLALLGRWLGLGRAGAWSAMLLFGLHPVVAEPVSWVTGRKDLLSTLLALWAVLLAWPPSAAARRSAALLCFALGLLAKPAIAPVCILVWLAQLWFAPAAASSRIRAPGWARQAFGVLAPYVLIAIPIACLALLGQQAVGAIGGADRAGASLARSAWYALGHHLRLLLGLEEPTAKYLPQPWPPGFVPMVDLLPFVAVAAFWACRHTLPRSARSALRFAGCWMGLMYLPSSNLLPLARYLADSYVYLPLVGAAWWFGLLVDGLLHTLPERESVRARVLALLPALLVAALCLPAFSRSQARFADDEQLWSHALARFPHPRVCRQWANGVAYVHGAEPGLEATERCIAQFGDSLFVRNKAVLLTRLGRDSEARAWLEHAGAKLHGVTP